MTTGKPPIRIGDLLLASGLIKDEDLEEATQVASDLGLPLGKILVMSGFVTNAQFQAVIQSQSMIRDQILTEEAAASALRLVYHHDLPFEEALSKAGWVQPDSMPLQKLGDLLIESGIVSKKVLETALRSSAETGLPLGRVLVHTSHLPETLLHATLNAQVMIRDGKITREQAVQGLKSAHRRQVSLETSLAEQGLYKQPSKATIRLGEMLVLGGLVNEIDVLNALEVGLVQALPLGQVLTGASLISQELLDAALRLQEMVDNGTLSPMDTGKVLSLMHREHMSLESAVSEFGASKPEPRPAMRLSEFLKLVGSITEEDIQSALKVCVENSTLFGKILLATGLLDEAALHAALRCQTLLQTGVLKEEQAIIAFNYSQRMRCSVDDALSELGWTIMTRRFRSEKDGYFDMEHQT